MGGHKLVSIDVLAPAITHGIFTTRIADRAAGMSKDCVNAVYITSRGTSDPRARRNYRSTNGDRTAPVYATIDYQRVFAVTVRRTIRIALLRGDNVVLQRNILTTPSGASDVYHLPWNEGSAFILDHNFIRRRLGCNLVILR